MKCVYAEIQISLYLQKPLIFALCYHNLCFQGFLQFASVNRPLPCVFRMINIHHDFKTLLKELFWSVWNSLFFPPEVTHRHLIVKSLDRNKYDLYFNMKVHAFKDKNVTFVSRWLKRKGLQESRGSLFCHLQKKIHHLQEHLEILPQISCKTLLKIQQELKKCLLNNTKVRPNKVLNERWNDHIYYGKHYR